MSRHARITLALVLGLLLVVPTTAVSSATPDTTAARAAPVKPGAYAGRLVSDGTAQEKVTMKVTRTRRLTGFRVNLTVYCWSLDHIELQVHPVAFPKTKLDARGRVDRTWKPDASSTITLKGRFTRTGRAKAGVLDYRVGNCSRTASWTAKRR